MSHPPAATDYSMLQANTGTARILTPRGLEALHPHLRAQIEEVRSAVGGAVGLADLLPLISSYYEELEGERRGIVRSMQLIAEEARTFNDGLAGADAGHLQAILDHIKDAVITVTADGAVRVFNPTGERIFGYTQAEMLGQPITRLLPDLAREGSVESGLAALATRIDDTGVDLRPHETNACHRDGHAFLAELVASRVRIDQRDVYVICLRDGSERRRGEKITAGERNIFARIAAAAPLEEVLEAITGLIGSMGPSYAVCIGTLSGDGQRFEAVVGTRLPPRLRAVEERTTIDIRNGSAAAAVYLGRPVMVADVRLDAYWQRRRDVAVECGLIAAWAVPIKAASGRVLGALTVYRPQAGTPPVRDQELMLHAARMAGIAIERRSAEEALRTSENKFRSLYERVMEGVYQCGADGRLLEVNPAFVKMLEYATAEELYALPGIAMLYRNPPERAEFERQLDARGEIHNAEFVLRRRDGEQVVVLESARAVRDADGRTVAYEGTIANITARKRAEQAMFAEKERAQVTLQSIGDAVITTDSAGCIEYLNPVAEQLSGWRAAEARGRNIGEVLQLLDEVTHADLENPLLRCLREGMVTQFGEHSALVNRLGQEIAIQDSAAPIRDRTGAVIGAVVVFRDVTKERRLKRALAYQASHDALTGLINRREFDNRLQHAVSDARQGGAGHALLYVDLDQFKLVNDTCGHSAGDRLLRDVTGILQSHVRSGDTIARLGGDEFGILLQGCTVEQAARVAEGIRQAVCDHRFTWEQINTRIGASVGVVEISQHTESVATVLSAADIACYSAKESGRNRVHLYNASELSGRHREMYWVGRVTRAVEENQLELYYQPIAATHPTNLAAPAFHELLVRLRAEDGRLVLPGEFIPAAERYNVVATIDRWVVERAVELLAARGGGDSSLLLALNLSGTSLSDRAFLDFVLNLVEQPQVARGLCFEITETAVITSMSQAVYFMRELKKRGCRFALDDFGSGLSSFHYLKTLPVDFLKIDGQFIGNVTTDAVDRSMVEAISQVGRALGIATIAEKVESPEVFAELTRLRVDFAQGYFLSRPAPVATLGQLCLPAVVTSTPVAPAAAP